MNLRNSLEKVEGFASVDTMEVEKEAKNNKGSVIIQSEHKKFTTVAHKLITWYRNLFDLSPEQAISKLQFNLYDAEVDAETDCLKVYITLAFPEWNGEFMNMEEWED